MHAPMAAGGASDGQTREPTESRFSRWTGPIGAGLALLGVLMLAAAFSIWVNRSPGWAYDFYAYYDAALRLVASGSPYQAETLAGPFRPGPYGLYLYAPPLAMLFVPLTWLGDSVAVLVWLALRIGILGLTAALMPVSRPIRLAVFGIGALSAPVLFDLNLGNISLIVTFLAVLTWRWLDRPLAGVPLALALMLRPTMGVIALWWLARGVWRPVLATAAVGLAIVALTLPLIGLGPWFEYATVLRNVSDVTGVRSNVDLGSAVLLLGGPPWAATLALYGGYVAAGTAILLSLRRDRELSYVVTVTATLLMAPLLWDHYLTHLLLPAAFLAARGRPWGLLVPIAAWIPIAIAFPVDEMRGVVDGLLSIVALLAVFLPFAAPSRGDRAGTIVDAVRARRASGLARA